MAAVYVLLTVPSSLDDVQPAAMAVLADEAHAVYLDPQGGDAGMGTGQAARVAEMLGLAPESPSGWLEVALVNIGLWEQGDVVEVETMELARLGAIEALDRWSRVQQARDSSAARDQRMWRQAQVMYEWSRLYPEAAAGDVDDPEADLALAQMLLPPVDPAAPHRWMPIAVGELECGFCDGLESDPIHASGDSASV